jgi:predicted patatin/cPLA2 family phospholipase
MTGTDSVQTGRASDAALIVEGGGMRGIFSTGVLDGFLERGFNPFHFFLGVSAGATSIAAYLAEMRGRNRKIYIDLSLRPEFINVVRFLRGGHLMDLDWLWSVTISTMRLNLPVMYAKGKSFIVGLTDVATGKAVYKETTAASVEHLLKVSSAIPLFYRTFVEVDGTLMTDGGIADPLPAAEAIRRGARRIMVIRSRSGAYQKTNNPANRFFAWLLRDYPSLRAAINRQYRIYNEAVSLILSPPPGVTLLQVCPPADFRVRRFSRGPGVLREGYEQGLAASTEAISRWESIDGL